MPTKTKTKPKAEEKITFSKWDPAEIIESKEDVIAFLEGALEENDPDYLLRTIGHIARSKGMTQIARELKIDRVGLYKSLAPNGNPSFKTVFKLIDLLGLQIKLERKTRTVLRKKTKTAMPALSPTPIKRKTKNSPNATRSKTRRTPAPIPSLRT